jgi:ABC-type multidrug transport system ATPase subunit
MATVEANDLSKNFGKVRALRGLTLKLEKGITGLVGPNGAGKTTTIELLLGLIRPSSGSASVFGFDCWRDSFEVRKRSGVLHEKPVFPGGFTGRRYLEFVARIYGVSQPNQRVADLLRTVGFTDAADRNISTYSAGMVQRIGLAQALIGEPELAILDEPTANLDPIGRVEFLERISQLHRDLGLSFIISTHVLGELETVCDQVAIIDHGVVRDQGNMGELARKYPSKTYTIVASNPQLLKTELEKIGWAKQVRVEAGGRVIVETEHQQQLQDEVIRITQTGRMQLISFGPQYGILEAIYRGAMEAKEND